jgi:hypothetical protein
MLYRFVPSVKKKVTVYTVKWIALLGNDSVKQQWKSSDRCYAVTQHTRVNNGGEDVFCGRCGDYITSLNTVTEQSDT